MYKAAWNAQKGAHEPDSGGSIPRGGGIREVFPDRASCFELGQPIPGGPASPSISPW
jgi:hypothetical protein